MEDISKILIVDDMQDNLQVMLNCLFNGGYLNVLCAKSGAAALEIIEKELPDLIILDWDMPGMNGIEVLQKLKKTTSWQLIPVIIATGAMLSAKDLETALASGAIDYIRKPFVGIELLARVKSALDFSSMLITLNTQKDQIEQQHVLLRENEKRLMTLLNASNEACVFIEKDIIIEANQLFYNFTGYNKEEVIQQSFYSFFPQEFRKILTELNTMERNLLSISLVNKEGETLPVEMIVKQFEYNNKSIQVASFINLNQFGYLFDKEHIADFIHHEAKLKETKSQLSSLQSENKNLLSQLHFKTLQNASLMECQLELSKHLNEISSTLPEDKAESKKQIAYCISHLEQHLNNGIWKEFKLRFAEVHTDFYDKLLSRYPVLTETDLRLCAFIKLKMSTKEIAEVINQPVNSVKVARNRLRSKLHIEDASETLLSFFVNY